jgi:hypothetical protein
MDVSLNSQSARTSVSPAYLCIQPFLTIHFLWWQNSEKCHPLIHAVLSVNKEGRSRDLSESDLAFVDKPKESTSLSFLDANFLYADAGLVITSQTTILNSQQNPIFFRKSSVYKLGTWCIPHDMHEDFRISSACDLPISIFHRTE